MAENLDGEDQLAQPGLARGNGKKSIQSESTYKLSVVQAFSECDIGLHVDNYGNVKDYEADHQVLVDGEARAAQGSKL